MKIFNIYRAITLGIILNAISLAHAQDANAELGNIADNEAVGTVSLNAEQIAALQRIILSDRVLTNDPKIYYRFADIASATYEQGNQELGIKMYEQLTVNYPDWPRPKLDLALIYKNTGENDKAYKLLTSQLSLNDPEVVRERILSLLRQIKAENPWSYGFDFNISPDDNINNATFNKELNSIFGSGLLSEDSQPKSDIALEAEGFIGYEYNLSESSSIAFKADGDYIHFIDNPDFNRQQLGVEAKYKTRPDPSEQYSVTLRNNNNFNDDGRYAVQNSVALNHFKAWPGNCWTSITPKYEKGRISSNSGRDYDDYEILFNFSPCLKDWRFLVGASDHRAKSDDQSYDRRIIGAGKTLFSNDMLNWRADLSLSFSDYDAPTAFFSSDNRKDKNFQASTTVAFPKIRPYGFYYPSVTLRYDRNKSNYDIYDTKKFQGFLELNREF